VNGQEALFLRRKGDEKLKESFPCGRGEGLKSANKDSYFSRVGSGERAL